MKKLVVVMLALLALSVLSPALHSSAQSSSLTTVVTNLQLYAGDLVRETTNQDQDGTQRAYKAFNDLFTANAAAIQAKSQQAYSNISSAINAVRDDINANNLTKASNDATALLNAVNDAAEPLTGIAAGSTQGLLLVMQQMKAGARDLQEEATYGDVKGTQTAYEGLVKLLNSSQEQINEKSPEAYTTIQNALNAVHDAVASGNTSNVKAAATDFLNAIDQAAATLTGSTPGMPSTGAGTTGAYQWVALAALMLVLAGGVLRLRLVRSEKAR